MIQKVKEYFKYLNGSTRKGCYSFIPDGAYPNEFCGKRTLFYVKAKKGCFIHVSNVPLTFNSDMIEVKIASTPFSYDEYVYYNINDVYFPLVDLRRKTNQFFKLLDKNINEY